MHLIFTSFKRIISILLVSSLILQSSTLMLPPVYASAQANAQYTKPLPQAQPQESKQFVRAHADLSQLIEELQSAENQLPAISAASATSSVQVDGRLDQHWSAFRESADTVRAELVRTEQRLAEQNLSVHRARQQELIAHFDQQMSRLQAEFAQLHTPQGNSGTIRAAALQNFQTALSEALSPPSPDLSNFDPITNHVARAPALRQRQPAVDESTLVAPNAYLPFGDSAHLRAASIQLAESGAEIPSEIKELAAELGHDPNAIFAYVYNNIIYDPYYGERKGALLTLWEGRGNDADISSLLVALLRASGITARYVRGTVVVDEAIATNWLGNSPDLDTAADILEKEHIPVSITDDDKLVKEHVWVEMDLDSLDNATPLPTDTLTPAPTATPTLTPTATSTISPTVALTVTPTSTLTPTVIATPIPVDTPTATAPITVTTTPENTPSSVTSPTAEPTESVTPEPTDSGTPQPTEAAPTEPVPAEAAPTEPAPTEAAPTEAAPTEAAPTETPPTGSSAQAVFVPLILVQGEPDVNQSAQGEATANAIVNSASVDQHPAAHPANGPNLAGNWVALDASIKQYTYYKPLDLTEITGFDAEAWIDEVRGDLIVSDTLKSIANIPYVPSAEFPDDSDADIPFVDLKTDEAISKTLAYIEANPTLTNFDLFGGAAVITKSAETLTQTASFEILATEPISTYVDIPTELQAHFSFELLGIANQPDFVYTATISSLANQRITLSYEAATEADQRVIDNNGGALLTTPPIVDVVPVLRIGGEETARGFPARLGGIQTRSVTLHTPGAAPRNSQNLIRVGETIAVGLDYGFASARALAESQQRLATAKEAIPTNEDGTFNPSHPAHMAEPIIGESLHMAMVAYFNQLDIYSHMLAQQRDIYFVRGLSMGVATQEMAFTYIFGLPLTTLGGGMSYDIQSMRLSATALSGSFSDELAFLRTNGHTSSVLEHSLFEDLGFSSVSTIRLLNGALAKGIPVYRIDATNKAEVFPRLRLSFSTENFISRLIDQGKTVTVSENEVKLGDWYGVGFIVFDEATGDFSYLISGGLTGSEGITNGGALQNILTEVAAYAWLATNLGLDVWGIWAGLSLFLLPGPFLLTTVAGIALMAANLVALGFDIADLSDLTSGDISASDYVGEQLSGLFIEAILKRVGIGAAKRIVDHIGPDAVPNVMRKLDKLTDGLASRFTKPCVVAAAAATVARPCPFLTDQEYIELSKRIPSVETHQALDRINQLYGDRVSQLTGDQFARNLAQNTNFNPDNLPKILNAIENAPDALGIEKVLRKGSKANNPGDFYELVRAKANVDDGMKLVEYGKSIDVEFQTVRNVRIDDGKVSLVYGKTATRALDGDSVYEGGIWTDSKNSEWLRLEKTSTWNQIMKARQAIINGDITSFRLEVAGKVGSRQSGDQTQLMIDWVKDPANWPDGVEPAIEILSDLPNRIPHNR